MGEKSLIPFGYTENRAARRGFHLRAQDLVKPLSTRRTRRKPFSHNGHDGHNEKRNENH
jgi:hypothetical protein